MSPTEAPAVFCATLKGSKVPYPQNLRKIIDRNVPFRKSRFYNPDPDILLEEILKVIPHSAKRTEIKKGLKISKAKNMVFYAAFADQHNLRVNFFPILKNSCLDLIERIETGAKESGKPLKIPEQLEIALDIEKNDLTQAIILLALSTRIMARNYDKNIIPLNITLERMQNWYSCVAPFGYHEDAFDPPGDTYHFWNAVLAGASAQENREKNIYELVTGFVCDALYERTAVLTQNLRYVLFRQKGNTHSTVDILGYNIGRALFAKKL
jgi:hypothetical protein